MREKLIIPMEEMPSKREVAYIGDRPRISSLTSVVLLDSNTLACCHFNGCRIFLVRFDMNEGTSHFLDSIDTTFHGEKTETDILASDGKGNLVTTNFFQRSCTVYRYEKDHIHFVADINCKIGDFVHGVKYYNEKTIAVTSRKKSGGIHFIDINTHRHVFHIAAPGLSVQDICFLSDSRLVMISGHGSPQLYASEIYSSELHIIDFNITHSTLSVQARKVFEKAHLDNIVCYQGCLYITDQYNNKVICLNAENLEANTGSTYENYDFPHGVDVNYGILAVTNYGTNSVELRKL